MYIMCIFERTLHVNSGCCYPSVRRETPETATQVTVEAEPEPEVVPEQ